MGINLPTAALVDKFIAKTKFYQNTPISSKLQGEFINKIQKITWKYKLSEDTIGISKTNNVTEIQVFKIELKEQVIPKNILKIIDKAIPYQILYQFVYKGNISYGITLKGGMLNSAAENEKFTSNYYFSEWNDILEFDFTGVDLDKVYQKLIKLFIKSEVKEKGDFNTIIDADARIKNIEKEIIALQNKISRETQFNRKVELNKSLLEKTQKLQSIKEN